MVWLIIYNVKIWVFLESLHSQTNKLYLGKTRRVPTNNMLPLNEKKHYHFLRQKHLMSLISDNEAVSSQLITLTLIFYTQNLKEHQNTVAIRYTHLVLCIVPKQCPFIFQISKEHHLFQIFHLLTLIQNSTSYRV